MSSEREKVGQGRSMSKAIEGVAMIGLAAGMFAFAVYDPEMFLNPLYPHSM